jgi:hypothetical protein
LKTLQVNNDHAQIFDGGGPINASFNPQSMVVLAVEVAGVTKITTPKKLVASLAGTETIPR